jgi:hypothetical protein
MAKAKTKTSRNFLGFGKKTTHSPKLVRDAYAAGRKSGDTSQFKSWLSRQSDDLHGAFKRRLEKQYRAGVQSLLVDEKKEKVAEKREVAHKAKLELAQTVRDVADALHGQGMKKGEAFSKARTAYRTGDSFDNLFRKVVKKNPAKFDRCVADVMKSLKKAKRPGNAYAICSAAGTRNARRLQGRAKKKTTKAKRNYQSVVWSGKQGGASAEVYKKGKSFEVELTDKTGSTMIPAKSFGGAVSIARVRLHELASNPADSIKGTDIVPGSGYADTIVRAGERVYKGVKASTKGLLKKVKAHVGGKRNPIDQATKVYEDFHGLPSNEILEITEQEHYHSVKVGIGLLVSLQVLLANSSKEVALTSPGFEFHKGDGGYWTFNESTPLIKRIMLTSSEDGKQLFFDGGDQSIPDSALEAWGFTDRDRHDHMVIGEIRELTYRTKKSFDKGDVVDYFHELGKEGSQGVKPLLLYFPRSKRMKVAGGRYYIAPPDRALGASPGLVG